MELELRIRFTLELIHGGTLNGADGNRTRVRLSYWYLIHSQA
jgi:hypothetical protein